MANQARMNDAAIALSRLLAAAAIKFGIFGGFAISTHGGPRESKDIDCLAASYKAELLRLLDGKGGFTAVPQSRDDYVAFMWSDKPDRSRGVLVEIFPERFQDAQYGMQNVTTNAALVASTRKTSEPVQFLDLFSIFKGKLKAAERRSKYHDSADLRWLATNHSAHITPFVNRLNLLQVGLVIQRYPELESTFASLGIDVQAAKEAAKPYDVKQSPPLARGDVQLGLLC
ncbi:hypothetical protein M433DRAFT_74721 [Acidomyces richmondensis BFW]|nr:hypothetical protein M433DRAFT_74721 [Acidomyces richmondensis BFW]